MEYTTENFIRKTKAELLELAKEAVDNMIQENETGEESGMYDMSNLERIVYVIKNCDYEGSENQ